MFFKPLFIRQISIFSFHKNSDNFETNDTITQNEFG